MIGGKKGGTTPKQVNFTNTKAIIAKYAWFWVDIVSPIRGIIRAIGMPSLAPIAAARLF